MIIDGKAVAEHLYERLSEEWPEESRRKAVLGILVCGTHPAIESFVSVKARAARRLGISLERADAPESADEEALKEMLARLAARSDALIVQLPLPPHIDADRVLAAIPPEKDVDALNPTVPEEEKRVRAPVALAIGEILRQTGVDAAGRRAVVVGHGRLVGAPAASLLRSLGADVSVHTLSEGSMDDLRDADIIVSGAGKPGLIKPEHIKDGVALLDAGTSEDGGVVRGDADPRCSEKASLFTPVPGGVGPIAVAMIFKNLLNLMKENGSVVV